MPAPRWAASALRSAQATPFTESSTSPPGCRVSQVIDRTVGTFSALAHSKQTGVGLKDLSGPPGILALLAAYVNSDWRLALSFLVLLNINLAIINLFPMPVLDGGHIVMALVERLFGRPLPYRLVEYTTTVFAVLLIGFMLFVSFNDVKRFSLFRSMFKQEVTIEKQDACASRRPIEHAPLLRIALLPAPPPHPRSDRRRSRSAAE